MTESAQPTDDASLAARGGWTEPFSTLPSNPPIYQTTAFDLDGIDQLQAIAAGTEHGYIYTRDGNPNQAAFADDLARLERADAGAVGSSGMGVIAPLILSQCRTGDHVLAARVLYGRTVQLLNQLQTSFGIDVTFFDAGDPSRLPELVRSTTKLCLIEGISNPLMEVADIPEIVQQLAGVPVVVDNTFATPILLKPMEHGAAAVIHSVSKYLNGHGDVMMGAVAGELSIVRRTRQFMSLFGFNGNPLESWLASRGLRTLSLRMQRVSETAARVAAFLEGRPEIERVYYPGLEQHPTHAIAARLLPRGCGGMLSFDLRGGLPAVKRLMTSLHGTIPFSPTLADARTTLSHPATTSHKFLPAEERAALGIGEGLVRLSVGLEGAETLTGELATALTSAGSGIPDSALGENLLDSPRSRNPPPGNPGM